MNKSKTAAVFLFFFYFDKFVDLRPGTKGLRTSKQEQEEEVAIPAFCRQKNEQN